MSCYLQAYPEGHPEHKMSAALQALQPGSNVAIKGPCGTFRYQPGKYKAIGEARHTFLFMPGGADTPSHVMLQNSAANVHVWTELRDLHNWPTVDAQGGIPPLWSHIP
jgi:ferredoxin-NADP reductase